jgi:chromosome segregation ATPase
MSSSTRRGLEHLRTQSSRRGGSRARHETYMRITILEMERSRRLAELDATRRRLTALESRLDEIDAECRSLHAELEPVQADNTPADADFILRY